MNTLEVADRERLARLLGMLGSDHAGERDNAGRAAHRLVQQHGVTWYDVVVTHHPPAYTDDPIGVGWRRTADADRTPALSAFVHQAAISLLKIVVRLRACGCAL